MRQFSKISPKLRAVCSGLRLLIDMATLSTTARGSRVDARMTSFLEHIRGYSGVIIGYVEW